MAVKYRVSPREIAINERNRVSILMEVGRRHYINTTVVKLGSTPHFLLTHNP